MTQQNYSPQEDAIIKEWYPKIGVGSTMIKLQLAGHERSIDSVRERAIRLGVNRPATWESEYKRVCDCLTQGMRVGDACRIAGIARSTFYKIRKEREGV